jgi:hypothetical protein
MAAFSNSNTGGAAAGRQNDDGAAHLYCYPDARDVRNEAEVYIDGDMPAAAENKRGAASERGNVDFFDLPRVPRFAAGRGDMLPFRTQTTAAAVEHPAAGYYNSGVVAGEALPLASQVRTQTDPKPLACWRAACLLCLALCFLVAHLFCFVILKKKPRNARRFPVPRRRARSRA